MPSMLSELRSSLLWSAQSAGVPILRNELSHVGTTVEHDDFDFTTHDEEEEEEIPQNTMKQGETFTLGNMGEVDFNDI